jgi:hypothetical protein
VLESAKDWLIQNGSWLGTIASIATVVALVGSIIAFALSRRKTKAIPLSDPNRPDLRFVLIQGQSMVGAMRRKDDRPNAQIMTNWTVTNTSKSGIPVRLLRAHLIQPHVSENQTRDIVVTANAAENLYSDTHAIPPQGTRIVSITLFCTLDLETLNDRIDLEIAVVYQLSHEHATAQITLPFIDPMRDFLLQKPPPLPLQWSVYKYGYLLRCNHGFYFVYLQFDHEQGSDRWFVEYEAGGHVFGETGHITGNVHGFKTFEEAKDYCEKDAQDLETML